MEGGASFFAPPAARLEVLLPGVDGSLALAESSSAAFLEPSGRLCPQGAFRHEPSGVCALCPRGRFGDSNALVSAGGCSECPAGTYRATAGGRTQRDCANCTAGRFASSPGAEACGGRCPLGKHSSLSGAVDAASCAACPKGYRSAQCDRRDNSRQAARARERSKRLKVAASRRSTSQMASPPCDDLLDADLD
jgi:hypothetical protein